MAAPAASMPSPGPGVGADTFVVLGLDASSDLAGAVEADDAFVDASPVLEAAPALPPSHPAPAAPPPPEHGSAAEPPWRRRLLLMSALALLLTGTAALCLLFLPQLQQRPGDDPRLDNASVSNDADAVLVVSHDLDVLATGDERFLRMLVAFCVTAAGRAPAGAPPACTWLEACSEWPREGGRPPHVECRERPAFGDRAGVPSPRSPPLVGAGGEAAYRPVVVIDAPLGVARAYCASRELKCTFAVQLREPSEQLVHSTLARLRARGEIGAQPSLPAELLALKHALMRRMLNESALCPGPLASLLCAPRAAECAPAARRAAAAMPAAPGDACDPVAELQGVGLIGLEDDWGGTIEQLEAALDPRCALPRSLWCRWRAREREPIDADGGARAESLASALSRYEWASSHDPSAVRAVYAAVGDSAVTLDGNALDASDTSTQALVRSLRQDVLFAHHLDGYVQHEAKLYGVARALHADQVDEATAAARKRRGVHRLHEPLCGRPAQAGAEGEPSGGAGTSRA